MGMLRFILALSVVVAHSTPLMHSSLVGGRLAVEAFYIISGFYMALILKEKYNSTQNSYSLFLSNRFLRIFPAYWVVLLITFIFSVACLLITNERPIGKLSGYEQYMADMSLPTLIFLCFSNLFIFLQDAVMFMGMDVNTGNLFFTTDFTTTAPRLHSFLLMPQAWTVALELTFYILAPFLVRSKIWVLLVLMGGSLILRIFLYGSGLNYDPWTYRFFPCELVFFLTGIVCYHIYVWLKKKSFPIGNIIDLVCIFLFAFIVLFYKIRMHEGVREVVFLTTVAVCVPAVFWRTKNIRLDAWIGDLSYPIYICHLLVCSILSAMKIPLQGLAVVVVSIIFSIILNQSVGKRIERFRQSRVIALGQSNQSI
jgi:peptidoglycan/LPS O-acetylase OafA/YrhL